MSLFISGVKNKKKRENLFLDIAFDQVKEEDGRCLFNVHHPFTVRGTEMS